ncbi:hypothetical protein ACFCP7_25350 [Paenibacillus elgii]
MIAYQTPKLVLKYEPPILLDVAEFVSVAGTCATGGGSCPDILEEAETTEVPTEPTK